ncbi:sulfite exporter TauE/SafE family protein [soil metagenome]
MFLTAFIIGFAGSLHCLGMCSPLVMAVTSFKKPYIYNRIIYNIGRILMYGVLGMVAGAFGSLLNLNGIQIILSFVLGGLLVLMGLTGSNLVRRIPFLSFIIHHVTAWTKARFSQILKEKKALSHFLLGTLNGLLPCGLTYLALTYCMILPDYPSGFLFMLAFGLGTLPVMLGFTTFLKYLMQRYQFSFHRFSTVSMIVLGILLIGRATLEHTKAITPDNTSVVICK